jgi:D-sedoheptulose 7-phosphate isomerase
MNISEIITSNFNESIEAKKEAAITIKPSIKFAIEIIVKAFQNGNKLLICGNGGSAADSQHFAAEFTGRYEMERKPLPAIALTTDTSALTAIGNDYSFDVVFSKQVEALGNEGDVLFAISTSGNSSNVIKAIEIAHTKGMHIITMTGKDGGMMAKMLKDTDINICARINRTARIQEVHILVMHTICDAIDNIMFK